MCHCMFQDDIGLGTVVGSAVFNIMFVISICALFAGSVSITLHNILINVTPPPSQKKDELSH